MILGWSPFSSLSQTILSSIFCGLGTVFSKLSLFSNASLYRFKLGYCRCQSLSGHLTRMY
jgi:hypothetical protein